MADGHQRGAISPPHAPSEVAVPLYRWYHSREEALAWTLPSCRVSPTRRMRPPDVDYRTSHPLPVGQGSVRQEMTEPTAVRSGPGGIARARNGSIAESTARLAWRFPPACRSRPPADKLLPSSTGSRCSRDEYALSSRFECTPGCKISIQWHPKQAAGTGYTLRLGLGLPGIVRRRRRSTNRLAPHRSCGVLRATGLF